MGARAADGAAVREGGRRYRSPLRDRRAAETRTALLETALRLFVANGWSGTGMREVASEAGVAVETVYAHFSSKRGLLRAVMDIAVVGDEQALPVAERPDFAALGRGRRAERIRAAARFLVDVQQRTAGLAKVLREAAPADPEIAEMLRDTRERQRLDVARAVELIVGRRPTTEERDGVWALSSPEVYLLLVDESGWSVEQYQQWVEQLFERAVPQAAHKGRGR